MVSFPQAIALGFRNYFNFTGVSRRSEYWFFYLFIFLGSIVAGLLDALLFGSTTLSTTVGPTPTASDSSFNPISVIFFYGTLIPALSIYVRRLRDSGRHWANIFWLLVPIAGLVIWIYQLTQPSQVRADSTY